MRVPVIDLIGNPGSWRALEQSLVLAEVDENGHWGPAQDTVDGPVHLDVTMEAVVEGILVRGTVDLDLKVPCARCLVPQRLEHTIAVAELFTDPRRLEDPDEEFDGYLIDEDRAHLDVSALLRDTVVMDVPVRVLCRDDCQGLCPRCGADRNLTDCGHRPEDEPDPRWAALADLDLPQN